MVSNETQTFILSVVDAQQDMTIKYTIFGLILVYVVLLWWLKNKTPYDSIPRIIFNFCANIYIYCTLFFLPLFSIMLFREYQAIALWTLILQLYGVVFVLAALSLTIFGWQKILDMFGIDVNIGELMQERTLKGETK